MNRKPEKFHLLHAKDELVLINDKHTFLVDYSKVVAKAVKRNEPIVKEIIGDRRSEYISGGILVKLSKIALKNYYVEENKPIKRIRLTPKTKEVLSIFAGLLRYNYGMKNVKVEFSNATINCNDKQKIPISIWLDSDINFLYGSFHSSIPYSNSLNQNILILKDFIEHYENAVKSNKPLVPRYKKYRFTLVLNE